MGCTTGFLIVQLLIELVGVSCIAKGSNPLFTETVLAAGERLTVAIPSQDYRQSKVKSGYATLFDHLVKGAGEDLEAQTASIPVDVV